MAHILPIPRRGLTWVCLRFCSVRLSHWTLPTCKQTQHRRVSTTFVRQAFLNLHPPLATAPVQHACSLFTWLRTHVLMQTWQYGVNRRCVPPSFFFVHYPIVQRTSVFFSFLSFFFFFFFLLRAVSLTATVGDGWRELVKRCAFLNICLFLNFRQNQFILFNFIYFFIQYLKDYPTGHEVLIEGFSRTGQMTRKKKK